MSFDRFYSTWFNTLRHIVEQLAEAPNPPTTPEQTRTLRQRVREMMNHYAEYYRVKSLASKRDVSSVFAATWSTSLERSLHWIGGWRPTTAFHLVYTESGIHFENHMEEMLSGVDTGDLGDLSPTQLHQVSDLQCDTVRQENEITDEWYRWQDTSSDLLGADSLFHGKMERLARIVVRADELRLRTVKRVVELLTPQQAAEFLSAAAELQFGVRRWGLDQDQEIGRP